jgi:hypothetical protein
VPHSKVPLRARVPLVVLAVLLATGAVLFVRVHTQLAAPAPAERSAVADVEAPPAGAVAPSPR